MLPSKRALESSSSTLRHSDFVIRHFRGVLMPTGKRYWLVKSEPDCFSIHDLAKSPRQTAFWDGVRNYQARNFMKAMKKGDGVFDPILALDKLRGVKQLAKMELLRRGSRLSVQPAIQLDIDHCPNRVFVRSSAVWSG
jgi:hypothetical protein